MAFGLPQPKVIVPFLATDRIEVYSLCNAVENVTGEAAGLTLNPASISCCALVNSGINKPVPIVSNIISRLRLRYTQMEYSIWHTHHIGWWVSILAETLIPCFNANSRQVAVMVLELRCWIVPDT